MLINKINDIKRLIYTEETTPPQAASRKIEEYEVEDEYGAKDCSDLDLKPDHQNRPLWIVIT
jgi:hypothetical protein